MEVGKGAAGRKPCYGVQEDRQTKEQPDDDGVDVGVCTTVVYRSFFVMLSPRTIEFDFIMRI